MNKSSMSDVSFHSHANSSLKLFSKIGYSIKLQLISKDFFCGKHFVYLGQ